MRGFWSTVSQLYEYEVRRRRNQLTHQLVAHQLEHVTEASITTTSPLVQSLSQSQPEEGGPPCENGVSSSEEEGEEEEEEDEDEYSTLDEQEEYEASNVIR